MYITCTCSESHFLELNGFFHGSRETGLEDEFSAFVTPPPLSMDQGADAAPKAVEGE